MKTIVLDDDPTGTQSASGVTVLLDLDDAALRRGLEETLAGADSVYVQTNSRAIPVAAAVARVDRIRDAARAVAAERGWETRFVLRGDSTLRGHVFPETERLLDPNGVILFVPAFPAGGRTTTGGVHYVELDGERVPADRTEFAHDPVFPFSTAVLVDYVQGASGREGASVPLDVVRGGRTADALLAAPAGSVVLPDAETDDDIALIAEGVESALAAGRRIVVRCAAPLAARLAGVASSGLLPRPILDRPVPTVVACGSHTAASTAQLARLVEHAKCDPVVIPTADALADPEAAGAAAAVAAAERLTGTGLALVATERIRRDEHDGLDHGERVMAALTAAVRELVPRAGAVVAKGGITSAELARAAVGAHSAAVRGQVLPGVSVWELESRAGDPLLYVVVPGNVGGPETLVEVVAALGR